MSVRRGVSLSEVVKQVSGNGTYTPAITKVIYRLEQGVGGEPKLATVVFFSDGTKTSVVSSAHDKVTVEKARLPDGAETLVASECSKEAGLVYALAKRMFGSPDEKGDVKGEGFGKFIKSVTAASVDQTFADASSAARRRMDRKAAEEQAAKPKAEKPKRYTAEGLMQMLGPVLEVLSEDAKARLAAKKAAEAGDGDEPEEPVRRPSRRPAGKKTARRPLKKMSKAERRAYWREAKRRSSAKKRG